MELGQVVRIAALTDPAGNIHAAIESFLLFCRAKNLADQTINYYYYRLQAFQRYLEGQAPDTMPQDIMPQLIREFLADELERNSPSTVNHSVIALRVFFNYLVGEGYLARNPMENIQKVRCKKALIETFSRDQVEAVLATCGKDFLGVRDRAIIMSLFDCGLRASELCGLTLDDISWDDQTLRVLGKGDKERIVPFGQAAKYALMQYAGRRAQVASRFFFVNCYSGEMDRYRVRDIVKARCKQAGVTGVRCSPHTLRHTFAVEYLRAGGDPFVLQKVLGHSDLTMTRRYCELSQTDISEGHRLHSPADRLHTLTPRTGRRRIR